MPLQFENKKGSYPQTRQKLSVTQRKVSETCSRASLTLAPARSQRPAAPQRFVLERGRPPMGSAGIAATHYILSDMNVKAMRIPGLWESADHLAPR